MNYKKHFFKTNDKVLIYTTRDKDFLFCKAKACFVKYNISYLHFVTNLLVLH